MRIDCPYAESDATPCVMRDGRAACIDGVCEGCGNYSADLLCELVVKYVGQMDRIISLIEKMADSPQLPNAGGDAFAKRYVRGVCLSLIGEIRGMKG